jgi:hypothetical protein
MIPDIVLPSILILMRTAKEGAESKGTYNIPPPTNIKMT